MAVMFNVTAAFLGQIRLAAFTGDVATFKCLAFPHPLHLILPMGTDFTSLCQVSISFLIHSSLHGVFPNMVNIDPMWLILTMLATPGL